MPSLPLLVGLAVIAVWGLNFPLQKALFSQIGPTAFVGLRYLIAPVCAVLLLSWQHGRHWPRLSRSDWLRLAPVALIGQALHLLLAAEGLQGSTPFSASVLLACGPVFTLLILRGLGVERLARLQVLGVAVAAAGALAFTGDKLLHAAWSASTGDAVLLLAAALFSYYSVASKPLIQQHGGVAVLCYGTLLGALPTLAWCAPAMAAVPWSDLPIWVGVGTLWSVVGGGFIGWLGWGWAGARRGVGRIAPLIYLMPVVAGLSAWAFAGERFTAQKLASAAVILAGVALAQFGSRKPPVDSPPGE
ncbi:drug/metabolite transporter (DMT)-like permease [Inhella inkyongensis]|uniref:Drug/metabolite transporter (DMT)-like permease n=1 Tax=Inhella inkyongensis TaxID=392593 RepID=A0A840S5W0_9BURK|nr:DMT family transporter [Inhella inkyongensis]MBB5204888.1 drug/metabolite transporter (DMT)-like permease [Inhella inkyongensis]